MGEELLQVDYYDDDSPEERVWRRRATYAEHLFYGPLPRPFTEEDPIGEYEPSIFALKARQLLRGIDCKSSKDAAQALALAAGQLIRLARFAWWPWDMTGDLDISADEMPLDVIRERGWEDEWLGCPKRSNRILFRELRDAVGGLICHAEHLDERGAERVRARDVEDTAYGAVKWAQNMAMLAVELDPRIAIRENW